MATKGNLRLYLDETGDHTSIDPTDISKRYLGLTGVILEREDYEQFATALEAFKRKHLFYDRDDPPVLHRKEIVLAEGAFSPLQKADARKAFDDDLLKLVQDTQFRVIVVVLDKLDHWSKKYRSLKHPYHYCLLAMLERYCGWLKFNSRRGDVLAESRGGREDRSLKAAYTTLYQNQEGFLNRVDCQKVLTSKQIKIKPKALNIAGLQLADLLAHPLTRDVLRTNGRLPTPESPFQAEIIKIAGHKYNRQIYQSKIEGYGRIFLR